jgi:hypothetical protein
LKFSQTVTAAGIALIIALFLVVRGNHHNIKFKQMHRENTLSHAGYDEKLVNFVNQMEIELAKADSIALASARPKPQPTPEAVPRPVLKVVRQAVRANPTLAGPFDNLRLTALIADDYGQHTAILTIQGQSQSANMGDVIEGMKVLKISAQEVILESSAGTATLGIDGSRSIQ